MASNEVLNPHQAIIYLREGHVPPDDELRNRLSEFVGVRDEDPFWKDIDGAGFVLLEHARAERLTLYYLPDDAETMERVPSEVLAMAIFLHVLEDQITMDWMETFADGPTLKHIRVYKNELQLLREGAGQSSKRRTWDFINRLQETGQLPTGHGSRVAIAKLLREEPGFQNYSQETLEKLVCPHGVARCKS